MLDSGFLLRVTLVHEKVSSGTAAQSIVRRAGCTSATPSASMVSRRILAATLFFDCKYIQRIWAYILLTKNPLAQDINKLPESAEKNRHNEMAMGYDKIPIPERLARENPDSSSGPISRRDVPSQVLITLGRDFQPLIKPDNTLSSPSRSYKDLRRCIETANGT